MDSTSKTTTPTTNDQAPANSFQVLFPFQVRLHRSASAEQRAWYEALGGRGPVSYPTDSPPQPDLLPTTERLQPTRHCYD